MPKARRVEITWLDITDHHGWQSAEEGLSARPEECVSVGYLIYQDNAVLLLCETIAPGSAHEAFGNVKALPRGCVKRIKSI